jgi:hypothetical protein
MAVAATFVAAAADEVDLQAAHDRAEAQVLAVGDRVAALDPRGKAAEHAALLARVKLEMARKLLERGEAEAALDMAKEAGRSATRAQRRPRT